MLREKMAKQEGPLLVLGGLVSLKLCAGKQDSKWAKIIQLEIDRLKIRLSKKKSQQTVKHVLALLKNH